MGALTVTNRDALALLAARCASRIDGMELDSETGLTAPLVKVGTIKRAKGFEFKQVLLARVDGSLLAPVTEGPNDGAREARGIARRELDVVKTRARDGFGLDYARGHEAISPLSRPDRATGIRYFASLSGSSSQVISPQAGVHALHFAKHDGPRQSSRTSR